MVKRHIDYYLLLEFPLPRIYANDTAQLHIADVGHILLSIFLLNRSSHDGYSGTVCSEKRLRLLCNDFYPRSTQLRTQYQLRHVLRKALKGFESVFLALNEFGHLLRDGAIMDRVRQMIGGSSERDRGAKEEGDIERLRFRAGPAVFTCESCTGGSQWRGRGVKVWWGSLQFEVAHKDQIPVVGGSGVGLGHHGVRTNEAGYSAADERRYGTHNITGH